MNAESNCMPNDPRKDPVAKYTAKDSVFTNLFSDPKYLLQLYRALHPEDLDATEESISNVTIQNILLDQIKQHGRTREAVLETIRICRDRNILREYLRSREQEVVNIMMTIFDEEYILKTYIEQEKREAAEEAERKAAEEAERKAKEAAKQAAQKALKETAKKLYQKGTSVADIADAMSMPEDEVRQWLGLVSR